MSTETSPRSRGVTFALAGAALAVVGVAVWFASSGGLGRIAQAYTAALESGAWGPALGLTYLAGLATALTPCVYPMIAITVSIFGARQSESRLRAATLSTSYVLGIAGLLTPLGVASALAGTLFGSWTGNPWVMVPMALLFAAMAASMFGAFDMALPSGMQNKLSQMGGVGVRGAFVMGLVSGLIAAPCAGPVISGLLAYVSTTRDVGFGAASMFVYSLGLGTLFWMVGTFAVSLPKTGRWVEMVKSVFGLVMALMAIYFLRDIISLPKLVQRDDVWLYVGLGLVAAGLAAGAVHLSFKEGDGAQRARKAVGVVLVIVGAMGVIRYAEALPEGAQIEWLSDYEAARGLARDSSRPLLVDFGADWCGACRELDHTALADPAVVQEAQRFVAVRIDLSDADDRASQQILASYSQQGLPFVVMHNSDGSESSRVTEVMTAGDFLERLSAVR